MPAHIGVDESGKGDYFGYLVIAGVLVDEKTGKKLLEIGVKDSKKLLDSTAQRLATRIKKVCVYHEVTISPEKYNKLYKNFDHNLNKMLAWGHATVIENLLKKGRADFAISDKFEDEGLIEKELRRKNVKIRLVKKIRAESDVAVAAASILARAEFLRALNRLSKEIGVKLPKGSTHVDGTIKELKEKYADDLEKLLPMIAKMHFKTTKKVLKEG